MRKMTTKIIFTLVLLLTPLIQAESVFRCENLDFFSDTEVILFEPIRNYLDELGGGLNSYLTTMPVNREQGLSSGNIINRIFILGLFNLFGESIYPYSRNQSVFINKYHLLMKKRFGLSTKIWAKYQVWAKWHDDIQNYTIEKTGAANELLRGLQDKSGNFILYRGIPNMAEFETLHRIRSQNLDKVQIQNEMRLNLISNDEKKDALFFSFSRKTAFDWSSGSGNKLIQLTIPEAVLFHWLNQGKIYVGVEEGYIEVAIYDDPELLYFLEHYQFVDWQKNPNFLLEELYPDRYGPH